MKPIEIIAQDLFDKVRSRFTNLQMGDETGAVTAAPTDARFFDFDFVVEGNNLGRVSISINDVGNLKIFYSQGITETADSITQSMWYDFLREMRYFAKRRLLRFDTRDITKGNLDKTDFQYLAQNGSKDNNMNESSMFGSSKTSHRKLEDTDLIIRHSEAIDPAKPGARSRKIKNLFIQNKEGERFKFPFVYLPGARAMQRHVANGGYPHDEVGKHIIGTCEEILKLSDFGRKVKHASLNDNAHQIAEKAGTKLKSLRHHMECMGKQGYYKSWRETYSPDEDNLIELDDATMESYKDTFTQTKFDEALAEVFPILHRIMQETGELDLEGYVGEEQEDECMECGLPESQCGCDHKTEEEDKKLKEFSEFENWTTDLISESFSDDELAALEQLVQEPLPVGANDEAVQALAGVGIKDPSLVKALRATAAMPNGADVDAREIIKGFMGSDAGKINWGDMDTTAQPAAVSAQPAAPADQAMAPVEEPAMAEGFSSEVDQFFHKVAKDGDYDMIYDAQKGKYGPAIEKAVQDMYDNVSIDSGHHPDDDFEQIYDRMLDQIEADYGEGDEETYESYGPKKSDIPAYLRKGKGARAKDTWKVTAKDLEDEKARYISSPEGLAKLRGDRANEGYYLGPEDFPEWLKDATHRVAHGKVADWTELYSELVSDLGFDENKAERVAKRIYTHDTLSQYRVKPEDDMEKDIPGDSEEDDDDSFLAKLRGQASGGSIKPGVDEDDMIQHDPEDKLIEPESPKSKIKKVAELVMGFYDRDKGTWTKGEHGVVTHVKRQFSDDDGNGGEEEAKLAAKLIAHLNAQHEGQKQFEDIKKLSGLV